MKKKVIQLMAVCCLLFVGMLGVDLASEAQQDLVTERVFTEAEASGCGPGLFNHHRPVDNYTVCHGGGSDTDFTIVKGHDCVIEEQWCCAFPALGNPCMSIGG